MVTRSTAKSGRDHRKQERVNRIQRVMQEWPQTIQTHFPSLFQPTRSAINHSQNLKKIEQVIKGFKISSKGKGQLISFLNHFIDDINEQEGWQLEKANNIQIVSRRQKRRTIKHNKLTTDFRLWFSQVMEKTKGISLHKNHDNLKCLTILSMIAFGGVSKPEILLHLIKEINTSSKCFMNYENKVWLDLIYEDVQTSPNYKIDNKNYTLKRWFPDGQSLALISQCLQLGIKLPDQENEILTLLANISEQFNLSELDFKRNLKLKTICSIAYAGIEYIDDINLPEYLIEYSTGRIASSSLPPEDFKRLLGLKNYVPISIDQTLRHFTSRAQKIGKADQTIKNTSFRELKLILKTLRAYRTKKDIKNNLEIQIFTTQIVNCINLWIFHLFNKRNLAVGTVRTYVYKIARQLINETPTIPLNSICSDDWHSIYSTIIENKIGYEEQCRTAFCLNDFHTFIEKQIDVESLNHPLASTSSKQAVFVKAGIIDKELYETLKLSIRNSSELSNDTRTKLELLVILAYRTGLRIGELLKLTVNDIIKGKNIHLKITNNFYGKNKTKNALRIIDLLIFLTDTEYLTVSNHLRHLDQSPRHLIFHHDNQPEKQWDSGETSYLISTLLKFISKDTKLTFHHFRHTALSNIQLIIEKDEPLIETFTSYSKDEANRFYDEAFAISNDGMTAYYTLARIAGHAEPDITFAHYLHFNDLLWFRKIQKRKDRFSPQELQNVFNLSANLSKKLSKKKHLWEDLRIHSIRILKKLDKVEILRSKRSTPSDRAVKTPIFELTNIQVITILYNHIIEGKKLPEHMTEKQKSQLQKSLQVCRNLAEIKTKRGTPRLTSKLKCQTIQPYVYPFRNLRNCAQDDLYDFLDFLFKQYKKKPKQVLEFSRFIIEGSSNNKQGVKLHHPNDLNKVIKLISQVFHSERLEFRYELPTKAERKTQERITKAWTKAFPALPIPIEVDIARPRSKYMTCRLVLLEKATKLNKTRPQASRALLNAVLGFLILTPDAWDAFSTKSIAKK